MKRYAIVKFRRGERESLTKCLPVERAVTIQVNDEEVATLLATPDRLKELAVGFLFSEGLIADLREIADVDIDLNKNTVQVRLDNDFDGDGLGDAAIRTSGCGRGLTFSTLKDVSRLESDFAVDGGTILTLMKMLLRQGELYQETGGVHTSALADLKGIISYGEDIGRHNTFDKILGDCFLSQIRTEDKVLLTTGRISSEMLLKSVRARIPVIASNSSPTNLAVELADALGTTLIGYARGGNMHIYTHSARIV
ncbi:MAG: formate dehydrogenase accessory sulfurtransferase FdhD [Terriglobia bacterium]